MDAPDPLLELFEHLERDHAVPAAWIEAHAPAGDLRPLWDACWIPDLLVYLVVPLHDRRTLAQLACGWVRTILFLAPPGDHAALRALEVTEAWIRHETTVDVVSAARDAAFDASNAAQDADDARGHGLAYAAFAAAGVAIGAELRASLSFTLMHVANLKADCVDADRSSHAWLVAAKAARSRLADDLRSHLSCPTLDQLRVALARA